MIENTEPTIVNLTLMRGDYRRLRVTVLDETTGLGLDLSDPATEITYMIARTADDQTEVEKTLGDGISFVNDGTDGLLNIDLEGVDVGELSGSYLHELEVVVDSHPSTIFRGRVVFIPDLVVH